MEFVTIDGWHLVTTVKFVSDKILVTGGKDCLGMTKTVSGGQRLVGDSKKTVGEPISKISNTEIKKRSVFGSFVFG
jgi:hypothetical protein